MSIRLQLGILTVLASAGIARLVDAAYCDRSAIPPYRRPAFPPRSVSRTSPSIRPGWPGIPTAPATWPCWAVSISRGRGRPGVTRTCFVRKTRPAPHIAIAQGVMARPRPSWLRRCWPNTGSPRRTRPRRHSLRPTPPSPAPARCWARSRSNWGITRKRAGSSPRSRLSAMHRRWRPATRAGSSCKAGRRRPSTCCARCDATWTTASAFRPSSWPGSICELGIWNFGGEGSTRPGRHSPQDLLEAPDDYRLLGAEARLHAAERDWSGAIRVGERAIANVLDPATLGLLSDCYAAQGDTAKAAEYAKAMEVSVSQQPGAFHRAWSLFLLDHGGMFRWSCARRARSCVPARMSTATTSSPGPYTSGPRS